MKASTLVPKHSATPAFGAAVRLVAAVGQIGKPAAQLVVKTPKAKEKAKEKTRKEKERAKEIGANLQDQKVRAGIS